MRTFAVAAFLALVSCSPPAPEPTSVQRGAAVFAPVSDMAGAAIAAELKKSDPAGFDHYLKEIGGKDEADLARKISREVLIQYGQALSVSSAKEAELKAGKADDAANARNATQLLSTNVADKDGLTQVGRFVARKVRLGEWKGGLELEFAVRILKDELTKGPKKL